MKKLLVLLTILSVFLSGVGITSFAEDMEITVAIPDYQVTIDNSSVYYADSLYPFLNYKGITYIPLTYEYSRAMNLTTGWIEGEAFMVAYHPSEDKLPLYETTVNQKYNKAVIPSGYKICVNGKKIDNENNDYPLFNFRGVTYFPLTWEYAADNFGWKLSFENNEFNIINGENNGENLYLAEKRENDAVIKKTYNKEVPIGDGLYKSEFVKEYYSIDYKSGNLTGINDYNEPEEEKWNNKELKITVENGYAYYNGQQLEGIYIKEAASDFVKPENVLSVDYSVTGYITDRYLPLNVVEVSIYTANHGTESSWGTRGNYTYIEANGKLLSFTGVMSKAVENVYTLGNDIYFNTVDYYKTTFSHFMYNRRLWKLSESGELTEIQYEDYNSMRIIGKANGKLYLKCEWAPENPGEWGTYSVSLVNDGYYTYDKEGLFFISPYIYSSFDIVSDKGEIISVNNKLNKINKVK